MHLNTGYQPLVVASIAQGDGVIEFRTKTEKLEVKDNLIVVNEVIRLCDGRNPEKNIAKKVSQLCKVTENHVRLVIQDLTDVEVLIDSRQYAAYVHQMGNNPMPYSFSLSDEEVGRICENRPDYLVASQSTLDSVDTGDSYLKALSKKRVSCRNFGSQAIPNADYLAVCEIAYGTELSPVPSAGALYPMSVFVIVIRENENMKSGVYQYDPNRNSLNVVETPLDREYAKFALNNDTLLHGASGVIVIAGDLKRHSSKYANRGYRYTLIEAGHIAQNVHLAALEREYSTLEYGGFKEEPMQQLLHIDDNSVCPLITVAIGDRGTGEGDLDIGYESMRKELEASLVGKNKPLNWAVLLHSETEKNTPFNTAAAHYKPGPFEQASKTYRSRVSAGTSSSQDLALIKAMAEGYERYSFARPFVDKVSSAEELDVDWVDPNKYTPFTDWQLQMLDFERFNPTKEWQWVEGENKEGERVYVPTDLVFYPYNANEYGRKLCYGAHSNGTAAHTSLSEAKMNAVHELIERDAIIGNWLQQVTPNRIPMHLLPLQWQKRVLFWSNQGWRVDVVDFSHSDVAVVSVFARNTQKQPYLAHGAAASCVSFDFAVDKAFHELEVSLSVESGQRHKRILPEMVDSPSDHGRVFHFNDHAQKLDFLFKGNFIKKRPRTGGIDAIKQFEPVFVKVDPIDSPLQVVRALSSKLIPINFGYARDHISHENVRRTVDQTRPPFPHYLA